MSTVECMTWNVHRCRGRDGIVAPDRTVDALLDIVRETPADLVVLTEADGELPPYGAIIDLDRVATATGLATAHADVSLRWGEGSHGFLGTVVLHGSKLELMGGHLLDLPGRYPRGATILTFRCPSHVFRVVATHLSLWQALRAVQMRAIGQYLARHEVLPTLLIGDLNEWRPWGGFAFSEVVVGQSFVGPARRSFPAAMPLLPLDRIMAAGPAKVVAASIPSAPALRRMSDHLPLQATVLLGQGPRSRSG
ncbi:endonuclease/exonuclease/phosphatase family protein [Tropicimonas aquimaris]|uniref:Endonuclease/exonuclease/phosphatase family protein n=1 Tax=Tropicimonas aquimaris TaxID=914152 RepID=A0ABW3IVM7_9RHOB